MKKEIIIATLATVATIGVSGYLVWKTIRTKPVIKKKDNRRVIEEKPGEVTEEQLEGLRIKFNSRRK